MSVLQQLLETDKNLLLCLNSHNTPLWDNFFWIFTSTSIWIPLYFTMAYIFFKNHSLRGIWFLVFIGILITLCDQISVHLFKEVFERLRPSHDPVTRELVHLVGNKRGGLFSFVSSHATNSFGLALILSLLFRNRWLNVIVFTWAAVNSYSRIYLGLHYPGDILGGAILGLVLGKFVYELFIYFLPRLIPIPHHNKRTLKKGLADSFSIHSINLLSAAIVISVSFIFFSAKILLELM